MKSIHTFGSGSERIVGSNPTEGYGLHGGMVDTLEVVKKGFSNLRGTVIKFFIPCPY
jgi:hypothetical protein